MANDTTIAPPSSVEDQSQLNALLSLIWRLPPQHTWQDVTDIARLFPEDGDSILQRVQRPSIQIYDSIAQQYYLANTFNKIANCYRSCFSDKFFTKDGKQATSDDLQIGTFQMCTMKPFENALLEAMKAYCALRYPRGITSVYVWDFPQQEGFAVAVLFKSTINLQNDHSNSIQKCSWDSIHVIHITKSKSAAYYKLKSTAFLTLEISSPKIGTATWGGRVIEIMEDTRFIKEPAVSSQFDFHIPFIGESIEESEASISNRLKEIALPRTRETLCTLRLEDPIHAQRNLDVNREFTKTLLESTPISQPLIESSSLN